MIDEKFVMEILQSREDRRDKQLDLINRYKSSLISFTLNTPGIIKDNEMYREIHRDGYLEIKNMLIHNKIPILFKKAINKSTGSEAYIVVDYDAIKLKEKLIDLEEKHPLGRVFDIDVFDENHNQINRKDLGLNPRKCLLCNKYARICAREKNHSYEELYDRIRLIWGDNKNL
mgnify:CR=1 FL=1